VRAVAAAVLNDAAQAGDTLLPFQETLLRIAKRFPERRTCQPDRDLKLRDVLDRAAMNIEGRLTYVSPSVEHMLGYTTQEFCTHYTRYLTSNPVNRKVIQHTELSIQGLKQPPYQVEIYHKDGTVRWLEVAESPIFDEAGMVIGVQGIATDITERHLLQQEQLKTEKLEAIGTLAGGIAHRIVDEPFIYLDKNYVRIFGGISQALKAASSSSFLKVI
jgi:PAS domain S-box-containing protein